jgi:hypothetical protein
VTLADGKPVVQVERRNGASDTPTVIASKPLVRARGSPVYLQIDADGRTLRLLLRHAAEPVDAVLENARRQDAEHQGRGRRGRQLHGVVVGMYAHSAP